MTTRSWTFTLDSIVPYVRTTQRQKHVDPRYGRYRRWKEYVRTVANTASVPAELNRDSAYGVEITVQWSGKARADLDNVVKGVIDALWKQDRQVKQIMAYSLERSYKDAITVTVTGGA